jgi:hypothetical protein
MYIKGHLEVKAREKASKQHHLSNITHSINTDRKSNNYSALLEPDDDSDDEGIFLSYYCMMSVVWFIRSSSLIVIRYIYR